MRRLAAIILIAASACFPSFSPEVNITVTIDKSEHNNNGPDNGGDDGETGQDAGPDDAGETDAACGG